MKVTDLMVGDWVKIKGHLDYNRVQEIARDENMQWYISFACSATLFRAYEFEPILITPEILEKNSIRKRRDEYAVFGWEGMKQWYVTLEDFKPQYDFWFITSSDRDLNISGQIRYIHQLQHALRICGLDELADNFKI